MIYDQGLREITLLLWYVETIYL